MLNLSVVSELFCVLFELETLKVQLSSSTSAENYGVWLALRQAAYGRDPAGFSAGSQRLTVAFAYLGAATMPLIW